MNTSRKVLNFIGTPNVTQLYKSEYESSGKGQKQSIKFSPDIEVDSIVDLSWVKIRTLRLI